MDGREWIARSTPFLILSDLLVIVLVLVIVSGSLSHRIEHEHEHEHEHENDLQRRYSHLPANPAALSTFAYISR